MTFPWQRSVQARLLLILVGLLSAVLLLINLAMARIVNKAQQEDTLGQLQIQSLIAAKTLEAPITDYYHDLEEYEERRESLRERDGHDEDDDDEEFERQLNLAAQSRHLDRSRVARELLTWATEFHQESGNDVLIADSSGAPLAKTSPVLALEEENLALARSGQPVHEIRRGRLIASAPILQEDRFLGVVEISVPQSRVRKESLSLVLSLAGASLLALGCAFIAALWLSRRLVQPLKALEMSAVKASQGHWEHPMKVEGQDELASLSHAFSTMLTSLREMLQRQRRFVSDASHELRTPLTRMKLRTEALLDGALEEPSTASRFLTELDQEIDRMAELTQSLLNLARFDENAQEQPPPVTDPCAVLQSVWMSHKGAAEQKKLDFASDITETLPPLVVSKPALTIIVGNLISNAVKYTPEGGKVSLKATRSETGVRIEVSDSGIGIGAEHLPHLFQRFYRADSARTARGTGLGLALVKAAAESGGGTVAVKSEVGQGSTFTVELPQR